MPGGRPLPGGVLPGVGEPGTGGWRLLFVVVPAPGRPLPGVGDPGGLPGFALMTMPGKGRPAGRSRSGVK